MQYLLYILHLRNPIFKVVSIHFRSLNHKVELFQLLQCALEVIN